MALLKDYLQPVAKRTSSKVSLGTIRENLKDAFGDKGLIGLANATNAKGTGQLMLRLHDGGDEEIIIYCSKKLSATMRAKEISIQQVVDFPIVWHKNWDQGDGAGAEYAMVEYPGDVMDSSADVSVKAEKVVFEQKVISLADMFGAS